MDLSNKEQNLIKYHREVLANKDHMIEDGALTSIYIVGVTNPADGRIYNVPGYFDGKIQSDAAAQTRAKNIGWDKYPSYENGEQADRAAVKLHKIIEQDGVEFMSLLTQARGRLKNSSDDLKKAIIQGKILKKTERRSLSFFQWLNKVLGLKFGLGS